MIDANKRRYRVNVESDPVLLNRLKSGDASVFPILLSNPTLEGLAAIEETIVLYSGNQNPAFYKIGGQRVYTNDSIHAAKDELLRLAADDAFLNDPAHTQALIASLGAYPAFSNLIIGMLAVTPQKLYDYQLLGIEMQMAHLLRDQIEEANHKVQQNSTGKEAQGTNRMRNIIIDVLQEKAQTESREVVEDLIRNFKNLLNNPLQPVAEKAETQKHLDAVMKVVADRFPDLVEEAYQPTSPLEYRYGGEIKEPVQIGNKNKKAVKMAFLAGGLRAVVGIASIVVSIFRMAHFNVGLIMVTLVIGLISNLIPLGAAFLAKKSLNAAGIILLIIGGIGVIGGLSALGTAALAGVTSVFVNGFCIVAGIFCLKEKE